MSKDYLCTIKYIILAKFTKFSNTLVAYWNLLQQGISSEERGHCRRHDLKRYPFSRGGLSCSHLPYRKAQKALKIVIMCFSACFIDPHLLSKTSVCQFPHHPVWANTVISIFLSKDLDIASTLYSQCTIYLDKALGAMTTV